MTQPDWLYGIKLSRHREKRKARCPVQLRVGVTYETASLRPVSWVQHGQRAQGYMPYVEIEEGWFDSAGRYLGPDADGYEPLFDAASVRTLDAW